ncbi:MAG: type II secretion system F family protein [Planctomycetota bacterium]|nr:type II secretion system F family protein [Planctomycetota bacterium]
MTQFAYTAIAVAGSGGAPGAIVRGREEAPDERRLRSELRQRGLLVLEARPVRLRDALRASLGGSGGLKSRDVEWFFGTLRTLLASAVPIESALATMQELAPSERMRSVCGDVRSKLRGGSSLADAVASRAGLAQPRHLALLRAGHESGQLAHAVALIDSGLATARRIRSTVTGRLIYPAILLVAAVGAVWFLATFVVPKFAATLEALGGDLPLSTRVTLGAARAAVWVAPAVLVTGVVLWALRGRLIGRATRARLSRLALRTPLVGGLVWHREGAVISDVIATMIEGGADVLAGLEQAEQVVGSPAIGERLTAARRRIREGTDLGEAFADARVLPPMVSAVLRVGIKGGDLTGGLRRASDMCVSHQERVTEKLLVLLEPAVIVVMAGAVGWVVYSLVMGMLAMNDLGGL